MSDALPLPPRPNLEQYKKLAKEFQHACKSSDQHAIRDWAAGWVETIARLQGLEITPELQRRMAFEAGQIEQRWLKFRETNARAVRCTLVDAQFFVARGHGFASWPKFAKHLEGLARPDSPISTFEEAVDAIVDGDLEGLKKLLGENPELVRARSTREHRSTLLHYVSANGVEDFRQKTPKNIVQITKLLMKAGADVNAESDAYGGRSTTLGLTATSWHPENAGVQIPLMEVLIDHGAIIDGRDGSEIIGCLQNGRREAAEFFAGSGARLDLEAAAGVGRLDVVKSFFDEEGRLKSPATPEQMHDGFAWACEFGRTSVVDLLLQRGMKVDAKLKHHGQTGLHWAAFNGHLETVKLLLQHGASVEAKDEAYDGTALDWGLYGWGNSTEKESELARYYEVIALLTQAGARMDPQWYEDDEERRIAAEKARSDPRMAAVLRGEMP
jgi:ankyrin repeat protein